MESNCKSEMRKYALPINKILFLLILACNIAEVAICAVSANWRGMFGWLCAIVWMMYGRAVEKAFNRFVLDASDTIDGKRIAKEIGE